MRQSRTKRRRAMTRGFTLIELLVIISIIGVLSSVAQVHFGSARMSARDVKRVSDSKQIQTALELFYEEHQRYPGDEHAGPEGLIIGLPETRILSDDGFGPETIGQIYIYAPKNPEPGGTPYVYRSLNLDGSDCNVGFCDSYAILFTLEKDQGSLLAGPHAMTPTGLAGAEGGFAGAGIVGVGGEIIGISGTQALIEHYAEQTTVAVVDFVDDERVETVAEVAVAPTMAAAALANAGLAAHAAASGLPHFLFFLTQPILFVRRRRLKAWGTVYNSLSRLPEDLVIVRLRDAGSGRVLKSEVTDKDGRFSFIVSGGSYVLEAAKARFSFPSEITAGLNEDGQYLNLYHGEVIDIGHKGGAITPNIPIDPMQAPTTDATLVKTDHWQKLQKRFAFLGPGVSALTLIVSPSLFVGSLFLLQVLTYMFFLRIAGPTQARSWGRVLEERSRKVVTNAVLRIFALPYHKLLETKVSDNRGRYNFRVGNGKYYVTVTKQGYLKTETEPIDLTESAGPAIVASDIPLRKEPKTGKGKGQPAPLPPEEVVAPAPAAQAAAGAPPESGKVPQTPATPAPEQVPEAPLAAPETGQEAPVSGESTTKPVPGPAGVQGPVAEPGEGETRLPDDRVFFNP